MYMKKNNQCKKVGEFHYRFYKKGNTPQQKAIPERRREIQTMTQISDKFDELKIYGGNSYSVNDVISIRQPTLKEIREYGEKKYFHMVHSLCSVGADLKWQLDDIGIDYSKITDFELFYTVLAGRFRKEDTGILFGDTLDFSQMKLIHNHDIDENVMVQFLGTGGRIIIDRFVYSSIVNILRKMHRIKRNDELPGNEATRQILIEDARDEYEENKNKPVKSWLQPLVSTMVNSEGFKRDDITVFDMKIGAFMDSVARVSKIKNAELLLQSGYSGFGIDLKKIDRETLNYMGELD